MVDRSFTLRELTTYSQLHALRALLSWRLSPSSFIYLFSGAAVHKWKAQYMATYERDGRHKHALTAVWTGHTTYTIELEN